MFLIISNPNGSVMNRPLSSKGCKMACTFAGHVPMMQWPKGLPRTWLPNSSAESQLGRSHGRGSIHHLRSLRKATLRVTTLGLLARGGSPMRLGWSGISVDIRSHHVHIKWWKTPFNRARSSSQVFGKGIPLNLLKYQKIWWMGCFRKAKDESMGRSSYCILPQMHFFSSSTKSEWELWRKCTSKSFKQPYVAIPSPTLEAVSIAILSRSPSLKIPRIWRSPTLQIYKKHQKTSITDGRYLFMICSNRPLFFYFCSPAKGFIW